MTLLLLLPFIYCYSIADAHCRSGVRSGTFNVLHYGARANGFSDDSKAFMAAWKAACAASGNVKLHVPRRKYLVGPVKFDGPCRNVRSITVDMQGYLKASTDLSKYVEGDDWIQFGHVDKLTLTGGGTFDGQGAVSWPFNKCPSKKNCRVLPTSIKFLATTDTVVRRVKSLNSKFFHVAVVGCRGFQGSNIRIYAPSNSPNTDGIHIERSSDVTISNSVIATGDDCISIGQGNVRVRISSITCGPGHGISVGSLGRYRDEGDVRGLVVRDSAISGTTNGIRIKTWQNSPGSSSASNMTFRNISMKGVANPIIIDQMYCPFVSCPSQAPSRVKISDIFFRDIRGTSATPVAVTLKCSRGAPCRNVNLHNVHLRYTGGAAATAECWNVKARYSGTQMPAPCH